MSIRTKVSRATNRLGKNTRHHLGATNRPNKPTNHHLEATNRDSKTIKHLHSANHQFQAIEFNLSAINRHMVIMLRLLSLANRITTSQTTLTFPVLSQLTTPFHLGLPSQIPVPKLPIPFRHGLLIQTPVPNCLMIHLRHGLSRLRTTS